VARWYQKNRSRVSRPGKVVAIAESGANPILVHHDGADALKRGAFSRQIPVTITNPEQYFINA